MTDQQKVSQTVAWQKGRSMVYRVVEPGELPCYATSTDQVAREGVYDSERAARYSFRFDAETLDRLQASVNPGGVITFEMLRAARKAA